MDRVTLDPMLGEPIEVSIEASVDGELAEVYRRPYPSLVRPASRSKKPDSV